MRDTHAGISILAALLLATAGSGGGVVYVCIGADGHVGLKSAPGACEDCCLGHVIHDTCGSRDSHDSHGSPLDDRHAADAPGVRGTPHDCDCFDIAVCVERADPVSVKSRTRQSLPAPPAAPARLGAVRTATAPPREPASSPRDPVSEIRTVVLLV
jgi:hypothetical protein